MDSEHGKDTLRPPRTVNPDCLFCKIVAGQVPADVVAATDGVLAFRDVNPQAPVHILIVPKRVLPRLLDAKAGDRELLGDLLLAAAEVAKKLDLKSGFRVVVNSGPDAGESVPHLHVHVLGQRQMSWPPG